MADCILRWRKLADPPTEMQKIEIDDDQDAAGFRGLTPAAESYVNTA